MAKGGAFESEVGHFISNLFGSKNNLCMRTDESGGRFTKKEDLAIKYQAGDLTYASEEVKPFFDYFSVECKSGYGSNKRNKVLCKKCDNLNWHVYKVPFDVISILDSSQKEPKFIEFWNQCKGDADKSNRIPILFFRRNQRKMIIVIQKEVFQQMVLLFGNFNYMSMQLTLPEKLMIINAFDFREWTSGRFPEFFSTDNPKINQKPRILTSLPK